jgi:hypothetical protein
MKEKSLVSEMIGILEKTGASELAELDKLIADREADLEAYCNTKRSEIDALRQIRKVCDVKLNGRKKPGRRRPKADAEDASAEEKSSGTPTLADWIAQRIEERGPQTTQQLASAKACGESQIKQSIGRSKGRFLWDADDETWSLNQ